MHEQSLVNFVGVKPLRRQFSNQSLRCLGDLFTSGILKHNCKLILINFILDFIYNISAAILSPNRNYILLWYPYLGYLFASFS